MPSAFPIHNDDDLERAFSLIDELWGADPGSPDEALREVMSALVDGYEAARTTLPVADPLALIEFRLRDLGWSQRELGRRLDWSSGRVSEVLSGTRPLTLAMVRDLSRVLELPAGALVHTDVCDGTWISLPPPLAATIAAAAKRRNTSTQMLVVEVLGRAFRDAPAAAMTRSGASTGNDLRFVSDGFAKSSCGPLDIANSLGSRPGRVA